MVGFSGVGGRRFNSTLSGGSCRRAVTCPLVLILSQNASPDSFLCDCIVYIESLLVVSSFGRSSNVRSGCVSTSLYTISPLDSPIVYSSKSIFDTS